MIENKEDLAKNTLRKICERRKGNANYKLLCSICGKEITVKDIEGLRFEYCKSSLGENYVHKKCLEQKIKKERK